jgi:hypothetical protein
VADLRIRLGYIYTYEKVVEGRPENKTKQDQRKGRGFLSHGFGRWVLVPTKS